MSSICLKVVGSLDGKFIDVVGDEKWRKSLPRHGDAFT